MTKLLFRHSYIYEKLLSSTAKQKYALEDFHIASKFTDNYSKYWKQYENKFFTQAKKLKLSFPDSWVVYFIRSKKNLFPFSDPLTLFINKNLNKLTFILIHELCHVLLTYEANRKTTDKLLNHVARVFSKNSFDVNVEVVTLLLARSFFLQIFGKSKTDKFITYERRLPVLKDAWNSIYRKPEVLKKQNPIEALLALKKRG